MQEHAGHLGNLALAAKANAEASAKNADALVGIERGWVLVSKRVKSNQ